MASDFYDPVSLKTLMKAFRIGCFVLIGIALSHLVGHFIPVKPEDATERELLALMQHYQKPVAGGKMTMMDIQHGLSLCYVLFFLSSGALNFSLWKSQNNALLKVAASINTFTFFTGALIALRYFFWLPVLSFALATACFLVALARLHKQGES